MMDMGGIIREVPLHLSHLAEAAAAYVIMVAVLKGVFTYTKVLLRPSVGRAALEESRLDLGRSLTLGLEFLIGADILRTAVAPSWTDIGQLAAIVAIRTTLNFFLVHELRQAQVGG